MESRAARGTGGKARTTGAAKVKHECRSSGEQHTYAKIQGDLLPVLP